MSGFFSTPSPGNVSIARGKSIGSQTYHVTRGNVSGPSRLMHDHACGPSLHEGTNPGDLRSCFKLVGILDTSCKDNFKSL